MLTIQRQMWEKMKYIIQKDYHSLCLKTLRPMGKWPIIPQSVFLWHSKCIIKELFRGVSSIKNYHIAIMMTYKGDS